MNNNTLREVLGDNPLANPILNNDHETLELLNYQIADIIVRISPF
jgi:hypothetical protein